MDHELDILFTLAGGLSAALVFGVVTQRMRLSPIVGYLLAGIAVGPFTPGFVAKAEVAAQFSELGVILLMFGVGLEFHVDELLRVRRLVVPGALVQFAVSAAAGALVAALAGWGVGAAVVFGLALSIASTVVAIRMLSDAELLQTSAGSAAVGWLVVGDVLTVLALVLLPIVLGPSSGGALGVVKALVPALAKVAALVAFMAIVGRRVIPALLRMVARLRSRELFTLTVLVLALGLAIGAARVFGASMALGALLAGMVVGQSEFGARAADDALPVRDAFAVLFFVAMGMLLDPRQLWSNAGLIAAALAVPLVVTPAVTWAVARAMKSPPRTAETLAVSLAQIGEFSFILATAGRQLGVMPERATQVLVATSIASITVSPLAFRWLRARARRSPQEARSAFHRAIVVGYGPVGRTLTAMLRENAVEPTIIERNEAVVASLVADGFRAVAGDASDPAVLERAGIAEATSLVFAASGSPEPVIRAAREIAPKILVLARTTYVSELSAVRAAGATAAVAAEGEVALAMVERVLTRLGATPDQIDRARDRVRVELDPSPR